MILRIPKAGDLSGVKQKKKYIKFYVGCHLDPYTSNKNAMSDRIYRGEFGSCCNDLRDAMDPSIVYNSFFTIGSNGVLYQTIGYIESEDGPGFFDHAVIYCPFCGRQLQDRVELEGRTDD